MSKPYYFTRAAVPGSVEVGELDFLRDPQGAKDAGGGLALLGTICQKAVWWFQAYPVPFQMTPPAIVFEALEARRKEIADWHGTSPENVKFQTSVRIADKTVTIKKKHLADIGADVAIPNVPVQGAIGFDFSSASSMTLTWKNASVVYMPIGNLQALYDIVDGDDAKIHPGGLLRKHFIMTSLLHALEYQLDITSEETFDTEFKAKAVAINGLGGHVKYTFTTEKSLSVSVKDEIGYVTAVNGVRWRDVKIGGHS